MTNKNKNIFFLARSSRQRGTRCPSSPRRSPTATPCRRGCGSFGKTYFCFFLIVFFLLLLVAPVSAQAAGLVPCGTTANPKMCTVCDFFVLIQNIINFLLYAFASLATLAVIYIAFLFMFSGGSPQKITDAKGKLWLVVIGIFWVLGSWLVLNTILNLVIDKSVFPWPWNQVNCTVSKPTIPVFGF